VPVWHCAGHDFLALSDQDMKEELGMTTLQIRKVKQALQTPGAATPSAAAVMPPPVPALTEVAPRPALSMARPVDKELLLQYQKHMLSVQQLETLQASVSISAQRL
jgi:hypothetical protein